MTVHLPLAHSGDPKQLLNLFIADGDPFLGLTATLYPYYLLYFGVMGAVFWMIGWWKDRRNVMSPWDAMLATVPFAVWAALTVLLPGGKSVTNVIEIPILATLAAATILVRVSSGSAAKHRIASWSALGSLFVSGLLWFSVPVLPVPIISSNNAMQPTGLGDTLFAYAKTASLKPAADRWR